MTDALCFICRIANRTFQTVVQAVSSDQLKKQVCELRSNSRFPTSHHTSAIRHKGNNVIADVVISETDDAGNSAMLALSLLPSGRQVPTVAETSDAVLCFHWSCT